MENLQRQHCHVHSFAICRITVVVRRFHQTLAAGVTLHAELSDMADAADVHHLPLCDMLSMAVLHAVGFPVATLRHSSSQNFQLSIIPVPVTCHLTQIHLY